MTAIHPRTSSQIDPRSVDVHFSEGVRSAFADLAATLHTSEHISDGTRETLNDIAAGKSASVDDVVGSLPLIAEGVFAHVYATGDESAAKAWHEIASQLVENGFVLTANRKTMRRRE